MRPGHQRAATIEYLRERGVNLMIGHIDLFDRHDSVPATARIIEIPFSEQFNFTALYLTRHDAIDRAIAERGFKTHPIRRYLRP